MAQGSTQIIEKKKKKTGNTILFWVMFGAFPSVLLVSIVCVVLKWNDSSIVFPVVDKIDIERHNNRNGISFTRRSISLFEVKNLFSFNSHTTPCKSRPF